MKSTLTALLLASSLGMAGCATAPAGSAPLTASQKADPWEHWNRKVFAFNDKVDEAVVKPVAQAYQKVVPKLVRTGVSNVLGNIYDVWSTANQFLQGKVQFGLEMGMRVLTNTFFGLGGLLDPASEMHLTRRSEDFGQTLGWWGVQPGPFVELPLLGPSTLRDTVALPVDRHFSPSSLPDEQTARYAVTGLEVINVRSNLLSTTKLVDQVALDRYSFIRDAYLARRLDQVYDGSPPMKLDDISTDDDSPPAPAEPAPKVQAPTPAGAASAPAK